MLLLCSNYGFLPCTYGLFHRNYAVPTAYLQLKYASLQGNIKFVRNYGLFHPNYAVITAYLQPNYTSLQGNNTFAHKVKRLRRN